MIDIHCHILPSLDDGAASLEDSLVLARQAVQNGIHTVIATPHHHARGFINDKNDVIHSVKSLNEVLQSHAIPLQILAGQEVRVYEQLIEDYERDLILSLHNSSYILIEFPSSKVPDNADELFHELRLLNLTPIIAHPERNSVLVNDHKRLAQFINDGALAQLTSSSISGSLGKKLQKQSIELCKAGLVQFIASDAHHATRRPFDLADGYRMIEKVLGGEFVGYYQENASNLIHSLPIDSKTPKIKKKTFLFW